MEKVSNAFFYFYKHSVKNTIIYSTRFQYHFWKEVPRLRLKSSPIYVCPRNKVDSDAVYEYGISLQRGSRGGGGGTLGVVDFLGEHRGLSTVLVRSFV
jgi:hypothetical protein